MDARYLPADHDWTLVARVGGVKRGREIVEILEAYDLTASYRAAAELVGCDHHTVARYVTLRAEGRSPEQRAQRARPIDEFMDKIEELLLAGRCTPQAVPA